MSHFAVVAPPFFSHYQALQALAGLLIERGHRVTFFHQADAARWLYDPRINFCTLGADSHPPGSLTQVLQRAARPGGVLGVRRVIADLSRTSAMLCAELPAALECHGVDLLLCDQMEAAGGLVAEASGLPFVSLACALPVNREAGLPLAVMPFAFGTREFDQQLYASSTQVYDWLMRPLREVLHRACRTLQVPLRDGLHDCLSPWAQISQTFPGFDFPRREPPPHWHEVGPLRSSAAAAPLGWPVESRRPLVFASLGTLQGGRLAMFRQIARACREVDAQLLIAHCGGLDQGQARHLIREGATWVTDFAPQQSVLARADALITHGGLNTVMDAIAHTTPMLVMPIAFDQPGVAARVAHHAVGLRVGRRANATLLASRLRALHELPRQPLQRLAAALAAAGGVQRAADLVEAVAACRSVSRREHLA
ncbi:glycosyltransferase [Pseudomonas sp. dw_358]|uniref:glycosyltransferase n=1 Tax=Pseudomonas sp. dw_358 TaxID=2720083 RepID=UPI001BD2F7FB|nr:glycosyltransferase [Pseudomonas sp. dw_358]